MTIFLRMLRYGLYGLLTLALLGGIALGVAYWLIAPRLPSVDVLKDVRLQVPLRVKSADDRLIALFGETKRTPVAIKDVPLQLKNAFLAAEDADFYKHSGIDFGGIARAVWLTVSTGRKQVAGGSTITQQVARMFFLSSEVSYTRKISEIFLAFRIENALTKDEILELYLNKAFFGHRSYGVAAAAEFYYGKPLDQLTLAESAMLASIPKFPSTGNPISRPQRALERRAYVLGRMVENGFITRDQADAANKSPDLAQPHEVAVELDAPYFAELVRLEAMQRLGNEALTDGYVIKTTIDSTLQQAATEALRKGLEQYDRRHGWRGAEAHVDLADTATATEWQAALADYSPIGRLIPALVTAIDKSTATLHLADGQTIELPFKTMEWANRYQSEDRRGAPPRTVADVVKRGDIVRVEQIEKPAVKVAEKAAKPAAKGEKGETESAPPPAPVMEWRLAQLPAVEAAIVAVRPSDGAVISLVGGYSFQRSKFNRATQSARQPGSGFKPFLYAASFDHGFTPASVLNDAPVQFPDPSKPGGVWIPKNDDDSFQGPIRLREALVRSVNLVSVRLLDAIGVRYARDYSTRFGFSLEQVPENLSMALGTAAVSPLAMARGYAVFANGGHLVDPYLIREITDRDGKVVYRANPTVACITCMDDALTAPPRTTNSAATNGAEAPIAPAASNGGPAPRTVDVRTTYLVTSLMRDVVRRGTGAAAMSLKRNDLAGKTGSTNDHRDAWFSGFNAALAVSCWVGFDDFTSLGRGEFGAKVALPIWIDYMRTALKDVPEQPFDMPPGIARVRIDAATGYMAAAGDPGAILELMKTEDASRLATMPPPLQDEDAQQHEAYDVF